MIDNLIIGFVTMAFCVAIQCVVVSVLVRFLHLERKRMLTRELTLILSSSLLAAVMLIMLAGNLLQMALWAGLFFAFGEFDTFSTAFYHSVVNFTTLGYGDLVMSEKRRLLGALEAANGVLMFGLTTGALFAVFGVIMRQRWVRRMGQGAAGGESRNRPEQ